MTQVYAATDGGESLQALLMESNDSNEKPRTSFDNKKNSDSAVSELLVALARVEMPPVVGSSSDKGALQDKDQTHKLKPGEEELKSEKKSSTTELNTPDISTLNSSQVAHPNYSHEEQLAQQVRETHGIVPKVNKKEAGTEDHKQAAPEIESELLRTILTKESVPPAPSSPTKEDEEGFFVESPKTTRPTTTTLEELPSQLETKIQQHPSERMELHVAYQCLELMQEANLQVEFGQTLDEECDCTQCLRTSPHHFKSTHNNNKTAATKTQDSFSKKLQQVRRQMVGLLQGHKETDEKFVKKCWICASPSCVSHNIYHSSSSSSRPKALAPESDICLCHECSAVLNPEGIFNRRRQHHHIQSLLDLYDGVWLILEYLAEYSIIEDIARRLVRIKDDDHPVAPLLAANRILVLYSVAHSIIDVVLQCAAPPSHDTPSLLVVRDIPSLLVAEAKDREIIMSRLVHDTARADKATLLERMQRELLLEGLPETEYLAQKAHTQASNH